MIDLSNYSIFEIYSYFFKNVNSLNVNLYKGVFYITLHMLYGLLIVLSLLMITNINYLFIVFIIICINFFVIFIFKRCPLAELERYNIDEISLENLLICATCIVCKIIMLMLYQCLCQQ